MCQFARTKHDTIAMLLQLKQEYLILNSKLKVTRQHYRRLLKKTDNLNTLYQKFQRRHIMTDSKSLYFDSFDIAIF